jgi:hypothetical protein
VLDEILPDRDPVNAGSLVSRTAGGGQETIIAPREIAASSASTQSKKTAKTSNPRFRRCSRPLVDFQTRPLQLRRVDTIKILFGLVAALLLGALIHTWKDFKAARASEPKEKVDEVRREIALIHEVRAKMKADRDRITGVAPPPSAADPVTVSADASDVDLAQIDAASSLGDDPAQEPAAPSPAPAPAAPSMDRAARIAAAPAVAKVIEWIDDPAIGQFATLDVIDSKLTPGTVVAIRRNNGILGRLKIEEITAEGTLANPVTAFQELKPKKGDLLIIEPPVE